MCSCHAALQTRPLLLKTTFAPERFSSLNWPTASEMARPGKKHQTPSCGVKWPYCSLFSCEAWGGYFQFKELGNGFKGLTNLLSQHEGRFLCLALNCRVFHKAERKQHLSKFNLPYFQTGLCKETSFAFISCKTFN